jgi:hypothetical protein
LYSIGGLPINRKGVTPVGNQDPLQLIRAARYRARAVAVHDIHEFVRMLEFWTIRADWQQVQNVATSISRQAELLRTDPNLQLTWSGRPEVVRIEEAPEETQITSRDVSEREDPEPLIEEGSLGDLGDPEDYGGLAEQEGD